MSEFTIKSNTIGTTHYLATCSVCGWRYEGRDSGKGNIQARRHVARTGHSVSVEKAARPTATPARWRGSAV